MPKFGTSTNGRNPAPGNVVERAQTRTFLAGVTTTSAAALSFDPSSVALPQGGVSIPLVFASILIILFLGRPFDQFLTGYHIPAVICTIGIVVTLFTKWPAVLMTRSGIGLSLFLFVMCVAAVFSTWRSGSAHYLQGYIEFNLVIFLLVAASPKSLGNIRWLIFVILLACALNCILGARFDSSGRLYLTDETLGNSDDVALLGGFCIPYVLLIASRMGKVFGVLFGAAGVLACIALVELSATRFAFISMSAMALNYFLRGSGKQRIGLLFAMFVLVVGSVFLLPKATLNRLSTITAILHPDQTVDSAATEENGGEAMGSLQERRNLVLDGLNAFFTHPILGVGPDEFANWRWDAKHAAPMPTHNTYLQAAAEEGFLGLAFYLAFNIGGLVTIYKCAKPFEGWQAGRQIALASEASLVYFMTSAFFITCVAHPFQFIIGGLAVALERVRRQQLAATEAAERDAMIAEDTPETPDFPPARPATLPPPARPSRYRFNRPAAPSRHS